MWAITISKMCKKQQTDIKKKNNYTHIERQEDKMIELKSANTKRATSSVRKDNVTLEDGKSLTGAHLPGRREGMGTR